MPLLAVQCHTMQIQVRGDKITTAYPTLLHPSQNKITSLNYFKI